MVTNSIHSFSESPTLREIHRGTIRAHHAKKGYDYPTIHLPVAFSGLIGLPTRIYQTVHDGALAFLVVVSAPDTESENSSEHKNATSTAKTSVLTWRRSPVRIRPSPSFLGALTK